MNAVVDASVVTKWYFEEPGFGPARALLRRILETRGDALAPDLIVAEFVSVLSKKARREECSMHEASDILSLFEIEMPSLVPSTRLAARALALSEALRHPVYDCFYVATAVEVNAALATADRALARSARTVLADVIEIA